MRKVYFFRTSKFDVLMADLKEAIKRIETLDFNDQGRYHPTSSDDNVLAVFISTTDFPIKLQFARIRRAGLPLIEDRGSISPLKIANSAGVLDWAHIMIFEDGIVAAEFNRDAPRLARLGEYLFFKSGGLLDGAPKFLPLFERAVMNELAQFTSISILEVEAQTSEADAISEADGNLGAGFRACRLAGNAQVARLVLKAETRRHSVDLKSLAGRLFSNAKSREALTKLHVIGKTDKGRRPLNLLDDYLVSTQEFMRMDNRTRALASDHAFRVIEAAYDDNQHRFAGAVAATGIGLL